MQIESYIKESHTFRCGILHLKLKPHNIIARNPEAQ